VAWESFVAAFYDLIKQPLDVPSEQPLLDVPLGLIPHDELIRQVRSEVTKTDG
jgi:hypothetical protein